MVLLIDECAKILKCSTTSLRYQLIHPSNRDKILKQLKGKKLRTTYLDTNGLSKTLFFDDLSRQGANSILAYGRLSSPFNINVAAHFYARHRIRLNHPYHLCVVEKHTHEDRYYPLELLELAEEERLTGWMANIFIDKTNKTTSEESEKDFDVTTPVPLSDYDENLCYGGRKFSQSQSDFDYMDG
uniref:PAZ domain-containing protein n=1 Tax=Meloidogyne hapla TaxID=6305 RepID=A0A1I8BKX9_MELHA